MFKVSLCTIFCVTIFGIWLAPMTQNECEFSKEINILTSMISWLFNWFSIKPKAFALSFGKFSCFAISSSFYIWSWHSTSCFEGNWNIFVLARIVSIELSYFLVKVSSKLVRPHILIWNSRVSPILTKFSQVEVFKGHCDFGSCLDWS